MTRAGRKTNARTATDSAAMRAADEEWRLYRATLRAIERRDPRAADGFAATVALGIQRARESVQCPEVSDIAGRRARGASRARARYAGVHEDCPADAPSRHFPGAFERGA